MTSALIDVNNGSAPAFHRPQFTTEGHEKQRIDILCKRNRTTSVQVTGYPPRTTFQNFRGFKIVSKYSTRPAAHSFPHRLCSLPHILPNNSSLRIDTISPICGALYTRHEIFSNLPILRPKLGRQYRATTRKSCIRTVNNFHNYPPICPSIRGCIQIVTALSKFQR